MRIIIFLILFSLPVGGKAQGPVDFYPFISAGAFTVSPLDTDDPDMGFNASIGGYFHEQEAAFFGYFNLANSRAYSDVLQRKVNYNSISGAMGGMVTSYLGLNLNAHLITTTVNTNSGNGTFFGIGAGLLIKANMPYIGRNWTLFSINELMINEVFNSPALRTNIAISYRIVK